jgi:hypothetical protein
MGAAFQAARLSGSFRVRSFDIHVPNDLNITFALSPDSEHPTPASRPLFIQSTLPSKKLVTVFRTKNFNITLFERVTNPETTMETLEPIVEYSLMGVASAFERFGVGKPNAHPDNKHALEIKLRMSEYGAVSIESAVAKYDETINITKRVKVLPSSLTNATGNSTTSGNTSASTEAAKDDNDKAAATSVEDANQQTDGTNGTTSNGTKSKDTKYETVNTTKTVKHRENVMIFTRQIKTPLPMAQDDFQRAAETLVKLKEVDDAKFQLSEAKNTLESLIFETKYDGFFGDDQLKPFYNKTEGDEILKTMQETEEWMETTESPTVMQLKRNHRQLKALTDIIILRYEQYKSEKLLNETMMSKKTENTTASFTTKNTTITNTTSGTGEPEDVVDEADVTDDIPLKGDNDDDDEDDDDDRDEL